MFEQACEVIEETLKAAAEAAAKPLKEPDPDPGHVLTQPMAAGCLTKRNAGHIPGETQSRVGQDRRGPDSRGAAVG